MRTVRTISEIRAHVAHARGEGRSVGLVPTMGAFHAGHEALIRAARAACDEVIVSLFVNPAQFNEASDLDAYPRTEASDAAIAAELGVDVLFAPSVAEIYPDGFATSVRVAGLSAVLEGAERGPGHFDGVCTVVCKLFNIVTPDVAYFGQKDAQQVVVIRRMVLDLNIPVRLEVVPTVREADGLAMSSRNRYLDETERDEALVLYRALTAGAKAGMNGPDAVLAAAHAELEAVPSVKIDYLALRAPDLGPVIGPGEARMLIAARVGTTRLIDNISITLR
jgi:pantoate--beta-alanine ligase